MLRHTLLRGNSQYVYISPINSALIISSYPLRFFIAEVIGIDREVLGFFERNVSTGEIVYPYDYD